MSSLLCVKSMTGTVQVHNEQRVEELANNEEDTDAQNPLMAMPRPRSKSRHFAVKRPMSTPNLASPNSSFSIPAYALRNFDRRGSNWVSKKHLQDIQGQSLKDPNSFHWLCSPLLETEHTFVKDVENYLDHKDMLDLRKKELLHKNWSNRVYEPIRQKVIGAINSNDWPDKDRRRRELHRQYLEHVNKKGHVFLDTMDEGEYYAQALNHHRPASITVHTQNLDDPLLAQERERHQEDQVVLHCVTGQIYSHADIDQVHLPPLPLVPLGRHGTDSVRWLEMPLANIESTPRRASRRKCTLPGIQDIE